MSQFWPVITALKTDRGLALQDLLAGAYEYIDSIEFPPAARVYLLDQLATTESAALLRSGPLHVTHLIADTDYQPGQMKGFS
jgi:hypothetical protein